MDHNERPPASLVPAGLLIAPIHCPNAETPLRLGVLLHAEPEPGTGTFVLLRELPGCRVYLGAICDADARIQDWVEIWVQELALRDVAFSNYQERLDNSTFDQRWRLEFENSLISLPETVIVTGMEKKNPSPLLIKRPSDQPGSVYASVEPTHWQICKDDTLLSSFGLPPYSTSSFRYLYDPVATGPKTFLATDADAPSNSHVQGLDRLIPITDGHEVFNPHAGFVRITRFSPIELEDHLQILEGRAWNGPVPAEARVFAGSVYAALQDWSARPKGFPFLLHSDGGLADRLNEIFFLKLSALREMFKEVRSYVKAQQLPLLNLSPASFRVSLPNVGDQFPALWAAKFTLVKPSQAYPLRLKFTEQKYFVRLGRIEPSPFLPEGLGAHSFGIGSVRIRKVTSEADGMVLEGTLVADDYLAVDTHDLLWFKLPLGEERLEFYAHVYTSETVGRKEARFRTVPTKYADAVLASLKRSAGTAFQRSPYEIWPLLSSPCDMFSLGVMAIRILLANSQSNLPVILDEVLSLARHVGKESTDADTCLPQLRQLIERDQQVLDLISPHALIEAGGSPQQARSNIHMELWLETIALLLQFFPGTGAHSFCKGFGDVPPLALETVFDRPIQKLETLVLRLRSVLTPSLSANQEIASVLLDQLANL